MFGESDTDRNPREIVIRERRMAGVAGNQDFLTGCPRNEKLAQCQVALRVTGIDEDLVFALFEFLQIVMRQAETPGFLVIARAIRNQVRLVRETE
jgi:hypothetical protein